jgi:iron complex outermembrane receptor protein
MRLASKDGRLNGWSAASTPTRRSRWTRPSDRPAQGGGTTAYTSVGPAKLRGEGGVRRRHLSLHADKFDVQAGVRYSSNDQDSASTTTIAPRRRGSSAPARRCQDQSSDDAVTWLFTPRYKVSPDMMAYLRIATGYRPGGPNSTGVTGIPLSFKSDSVVSYEAGLKGAIPVQRHLRGGAVPDRLGRHPAIDHRRRLPVHLLHQRLDRPQPRRRAVGALGAVGVVDRGQHDLPPGRELTDDLRSPAGASPIYGSKGDRLPGSARFSSQPFGAVRLVDRPRLLGLRRRQPGLCRRALRRVRQHPADPANEATRVKLPSYTTDRLARRPL